MITTKISFGKPKQDGSMAIYIVLTKNRQRKQIRLPFMARAEDVDGKGEIIDGLLNYAVTEQMQLIRKRLLENASQLERMNVNEVAEMVSQSKAAPTSKEFKLDFIAYGRQHTDQLIREGREKTAYGYRSALNAFAAFMRRDSVDINEITKNLLMKFGVWFKNEGKGDRAWELYMSNLQALHNKAKKEFNDEEDGKVVIPMSPFGKVDFKRSAAEVRSVEKRALSVKALKALFAVPREEDETSRENTARDAFMLSLCLCGMNAADMWDLKRTEETDDNVVEFWRRKTRRRSGEESHIRITMPEVAKAAYNRNKGSRHVWNFGERYSTTDTFVRALSKGLEQWVEHTIEYHGRLMGEDTTTAEGRKRVMKAIELPDKVTSYAARHSWATIAANECGVPIETVDMCLCHVGQTLAATTYVRRDWSKVDEANGKVVSLIFG